MPRKLTVAQRALLDARRELTIAGMDLAQHKATTAHILAIQTSGSYVRPEEATRAVRALYRWSLAYLNLERLEYPDSPGGPVPEPQEVADAPVD